MGGIIHANLCGSMEVNSIGLKYFLLLDDFFSYRIVYFLKRIENETEKKVKIFCTNNVIEKINNCTINKLLEEN